MKTTTKEIKLYEIDELSEEAKEKAYNQWVESNDYPFFSEFMDFLKIICGSLGYKIGNYNIGYCQKNWLFISSKYDEIENLTGNKLYKYVINRIITYRAKTYIKTNKKRVSKILKKKQDITGFYVDYCFDYAMDKFRKDKNMNLNEFMEILKNEWLRLVTNDIEYQNSFECFIDTCNNNEYMFTEDGRLY